MVPFPTPVPSSAVNRQAAGLLQEVKRALHGKSKNTIQVHLEVSAPLDEEEDDTAKLLFYYHPRLLPNRSKHCFTDTYDVDQALRVNTAARRVENQYFIKLLTRRLGLRSLFGPGWEQGTYYPYVRHSTVSSSFGYKKLLAALNELAELPLADSVLVSDTQRRANKEDLRQELLTHFGVHPTAAYYGNFTDQELHLQVGVVSGQPSFELVTPGGQAVMLDEATYDYLTLADSWAEHDYHPHRLSQISTARFQAGAQYQIMLSELLYVLA
ncbi:MAG: hypothetical protein EOO61_07620 [Hymenobacter sp.]|nr:MAG: hypothetical protein EOO61_07620 [Hymenobacter sp.]